jgi:hypothetical protein
MMAYKTYHLRAPDTRTFLSDAKTAIDSAGIDPYEKGLLHKDENGNDVPGQGVDVIPAGRWYITEPTFDENGEMTDPGEKGGYALINIRTKDLKVKAVIEGLEPSDAGKQPPETPTEQTIGGGTHRVDGDTIDSPVHVFATVEE